MYWGRVTETRSAAAVFSLPIPIPRSEALGNRPVFRCFLKEPVGPGCRIPSRLAKVSGLV
ncbi:hypothetical protein EYF80_054974 [Liparis tanakae]|uniref:Uncharacterized protein n=1 Tax=Liparis tanakae TaxID=230148 RepID=A0A4Z2F1G2_9TELE|nr:hypothetical protein EYF80_054974 [Liparis tanakae]